MRVCCFFIILVFVHFQCNAWFVYDRAISSAQKDDWNTATSLLTKKISDSPDQADLLYDAGVVSYRSDDVEKGQAYFKHAAEHAIKDSQLEEQSCFNYGNCCVRQNQLKEAVEAYERVLEINLENERARHNLEIVKKMLEQQKEKQKNQQQDKKEQQSDEDQKRKKTEEQNNQPQEQCDDKKESGQQKQKNDNNNGDDQHDKNGQADKEELPDDEDKIGENTQKQQESDDAKNSRQEDLENQKEKEKQSSQGYNNEQEESKQKKEGDNGDDNDGKTSEINKEENGTEPEKKASEFNSADESNQGEKLDGWLAEILDKNEERDALHQKYLIKNAVSKEMVGNDGQNCW